MFLGNFARHSFFFTLTFFLLFAVLITIVFIPDKKPQVDNVIFPPYVRDAEMKILFSHEMEKSQVESNLVVSPKTPYSLSWSGKTLVISFQKTLDFDQLYTLSLKKALTKKQIPLSGKLDWEFRTKPESILYISTEKNSFGQLMQYFVKTGNQKALTPLEYQVQHYDVDQWEEEVIVHISDKKQSKSAPMWQSQFARIDLVSGNFALIPLQDAGLYRNYRVNFLPFEKSFLYVRTKYIQDDSGIHQSFEDSDTHLVQYNFETGASQILQTGSSLQYGIYPAPDGRALISIDTKSGNLMFANLMTNQQEFLTTNFLDIYGVSEYGKYIVISRVPENEGVFSPGNMLTLLGNNAKETTILDGSEGLIDHPQFSPNEKEIVLKYIAPESAHALQRHYTLGLYTVGNDMIQSLTSENEGAIDQPKFSPNAEKISYILFENKSLQDPQGGWDEFEKTYNGAPVFVYDRTKNISQRLPIEGADIIWLY